MEIHNNDNRPQAQRKKVDLSKKITRETPSAQRSLKTNVNRQIGNGTNNKNGALVRNAKAAAKKSASAVGKVTGAAGRTIDGVGSAIAASADNSTAGGAAIAQGVKTTQAAASAAAAGGKAVKTTIKTTVKVVAKVPRAVKSAHFARKFARKKGIKRTMRLVKRNFKPHSIAKGANKSVGGIARTGSSVSRRAAYAIESSLRSGDSTGTAATGLAMQGGRALGTGVRLGGKAVKTSAKVTMRTVKTARKIATKVERKITTGTAKRAMKTSAKAAKQAAKTAKKTAEVSVKVSAKIAKAISMAVSKAASLIASTAPWSLILIGGIAVIMCGGFLLSGGAGVASAGSKKQGFDTIANSSYSDEYIENLTDEQAESIVKSKTNSFSADVKKSVDEKIIAPLKSKVNDFLMIGDSDDSSVSEDSSASSGSIENIDIPAKERRIIEININGANTVFFPAEEESDEIAEKINNIVFDGSDFLAALYTLMTRHNTVYIDDETGLTNIRFDFTASVIEDFLGDIDSNSCEYGPTYLYKNIEELSECSCPDQNCDTKDGLPYCPGEHVKLTIELCPITIHEYKPIYVIYNFSDDEVELYNTAIVLLGGD